MMRKHYEEKLKSISKFKCDTGFLKI